MCTLWFETKNLKECLESLAFEVDAGGCIARHQSLRFGWTQKGYLAMTHNFVLTWKTLFVASNTRLSHCESFCIFSNMTSFLFRFRESRDQGHLPNLDRMTYVIGNLAKFPFVFFLLMTYFRNAKIHTTSLSIHAFVVIDSISI